MGFTNFWRKAPFDMAVDLGTSNVLITTVHGICVNEPSCVAMRADANLRNEVTGVGSEAATLIGKAPQGLTVVQPLSQGVISEFELSSTLLRALMPQAQGPHARMRGPRLLLALPSDVTPVEERAFREVGLRAGARDVTLVPEPVAAALGAGIDIFRPRGEMIVDVGGGITEVALFSLGGLVYSHSVRIGGNDMDAAIVQYVRSRHNFEIGVRTAEFLKLQSSRNDAGAGASHTHRADNEANIQIKGLNLVTRLPSTLWLRAGEIQEALSPLVRQIVQAVMIGLERAPEELSADLTESGLWLCGGACLTADLRQQLSDATGLRVHVGATPMLNVAQGEMTLLRDQRLIEKLQGLH